MIGPTTAEVFLDRRSLSKVLPALASHGISPILHTLSEADLPRRAAAYLRGYFKLLRLKTLEDFSTAQQLFLLDQAQALIPLTYKKLSEQTKWLRTIAVDREEILRARVPSPAPA
jgi:hypothetical protein